MTSGPDWNAQRYHRVSEPQYRWGLQVLAELSLQGDETVLDAGCGTGRVTAKLLERLPRGRVLALDASPNMLERAKEELLPAGEGRVAFEQADLGQLALGPVVDVVFSTATFHWVLDHEALFAGLYRALKPRGLLHAQCGGGPNLARVYQRARAQMARPEFAAAFVGWSDQTTYADVEPTRERLARAGFVDVQVWLTEAPASFDTAAALSEYLEGVVLRHHLAKLAPPMAASFLARLVEQAAADAPPYTLDYWRLNLRARKP